MATFGNSRQDSAFRVATGQPRQLQESPSFFVGQRPVLRVSDWAIESQPHLWPTGARRPKFIEIGYGHRLWWGRRPRVVDLYCVEILLVLPVALCHVAKHPTVCVEVAVDWRHLVHRLYWYTADCLPVLLAPCIDYYHAGLFYDSCLVYVMYELWYRLTDSFLTPIWYSWRMYWIVTCVALYMSVIM